jgi:hypothetical protein
MAKENDLIIFRCGHIMACRGIVLVAGTYLSAKRSAYDCPICRKKLEKVGDELYK